MRKRSRREQRKTSSERYKTGRKVNVKVSSPALLLCGIICYPAVPATVLPCDMTLMQRQTYWKLARLWIFDDAN